MLVPSAMSKNVDVRVDTPVDTIQYGVKREGKEVSDARFFGGKILRKIFTRELCGKIFAPDFSVKILAGK